MNKQRITMFISAVLIGLGCGYIAENTINLYGGYVESITFFVVTIVAASLPLKIAHRLLVGMAVGGMIMLALFVIGFYGGQMGNEYEKFFVPGIISWSVAGILLGLGSGLLSSALWVMVRPIKRLSSNQ